MKPNALICSLFSLASFVSLAACLGDDAADPQSPEGADIADIADVADEAAEVAAAPVAGIAPRHCVSEAVAVAAGKPLPADFKAPAPTCFDSLSDSVAFATKGKVRLSADPVLAARQYGELETLAFDGRIATEYVAPNFDAFWGSWIITSSADCGPNGQNQVVGSMPSGWNDVISSARIMNSSACNFAHHYEHSYFGGLDRICGRSCASMGLMSDHTSSILWTL